jgi:hypothetical protein
MGHSIIYSRVSFLFYGVILDYLYKLSADDLIYMGWLGFGRTAYLYYTFFTGGSFISWLRRNPPATRIPLLTNDFTT